MERIIVTKPMIGITAMQVCAESDVTDEEILKACNELNPSGTEAGWTTVIRENFDKEYKNSRPVKCDQEEGRTHFIILC